jgi:hypothetical protein
MHGKYYKDKPKIIKNKPKNIHIQPLNNSILLILLNPFSLHFHILYLLHIILKSLKSKNLHIFLSFKTKPLNLIICRCHVLENNLKL